MTAAAVLGAGAWGTALAVALARSGADVRLWCRDPARAAEMDDLRENRRLLPGTPLPPSVLVLAEARAAVQHASLIVGAVPSGATGAVARSVASALAPGAAWVSATKGLEPGTRMRMSEVVSRELGAGMPVAVLSGPSFAAEVAAGQPTAVVVASADLALARRVQEAVSGPALRAYGSHDVLGVELGGAVKNVIAIAAGMVAGLGLGSNPMAALVTRGLHEMTALAVRLGADPRTLAGLAGLGDLVLTCTGALSRNRRVGVAIASGRSLEQALADIGQVAEGVETTAVVLELAAALGVDMPITRAVQDSLTGRLTPREAVASLMARDLKHEWA